MLLPRLRGGKKWFAVEAKSFEIEIEEGKNGLRGCIRERRKGITSWIRFGRHSLSRLLSGLEDCCRATKVSVWENVWEEDGRRYKMEKGSNQSGVFIRCSVRDYGGKNYILMFPEGNGIVGGWKILAEKMRQLGVRSSDEIQREEKAEKTLREEKQRTSKPLPRLLKPIPNPLTEFNKLEKTFGGNVAYVKIGDEEVQERVDQLRRCLVGRWGSGPAQIPGVETIRRWARMQWNINNSLAVVSLGRGLWLFEFESREEVDRVLKVGKRRFGTNLVHLRTWGEDLGCSNQGFSEEKAWVRVMGLPVHLWSRTVMEKIGNACGGFLAVDKETDELGDLGWARILVSWKKPEPPNTVEVECGGTRFRLQLWWELSPQYATVAGLDQMRNPSSYRDDDGNSRAWERVGGAAIETAGGDVGDKHPVSSKQAVWQAVGQRAAGSLMGQISGQRTGQNSDQEAGRRAGWACQPFGLPGRARKGIRCNGVVGSNSQNKVGFKSGPSTKAIFKQKREPFPALVPSISFNDETEGALNMETEILGEAVAETSQIQVESQRAETALDGPDLSNRFEMSMPIINSPSLSFFGRPLFQGGPSGLGGPGGLYGPGEEVEGVMPMEMVAANEMKEGSSQEGMLVEYRQEEGIVEATPLAVEGYERWEDSMLVKFSEFLGFATEGFESQIIELMRQMVKSQNKGPRPGQAPISRCERELKILECTINYGGQRNGKSANRDRGNFLLKLG